MQISENVIERLKDSYVERTVMLNISSSKDLQELLDTDETRFYFYLLGSFLTKRDLGNILYKASNSVAAAISLFCKECNESQIDIYKSVPDYFAQFMDVHESTIQIEKVLNEAKILECKEKYRDKFEDSE